MFDDFWRVLGDFWRWKFVEWKWEVDVGGFVEVLEILAEFIYCFPFYFFSFFQYFFKGASKKHEKLVIDSKGWRAETEYKLM